MEFSWQQIFCGDFTNLPPEESNVVRVFLSSTFGGVCKDVKLMSRLKLALTCQTCALKKGVAKLQQFCYLTNLPTARTAMAEVVRNYVVSVHLN